MYSASYDELVCRTSFKFTDCMLHILQHVSTHDTCHQQGIFVALIIIIHSAAWYNIQRTILQRYDNIYEDSLMMALVVCGNML